METAAGIVNSKKNQEGTLGKSKFFVQIGLNATQYWHKALSHTPFLQLGKAVDLINLYQFDSDRRDH